MPKFLLVDNGSVRIEELDRLLPETPTTVDVEGFKALDTRSFDLVLLSGSSTLPVLGNEALFSDELQFIREAHIPIIGICLGAELIGHAFSGTLHDLGEKRKGMVDIVSTDTDGLLLELGRHFSVYEAHRFALASVPSEFLVLAKSDHGPEILKHATLPIWGLQFHPEHLTDETVGDEIFSRIINRSLLSKKS
ncbi:MAG: gamma-glutamyl-gamma-aminobutyrate hydrolase family protein [Candidatus Moraniibacteriota bacterium]